MSALRRARARLRIGLRRRRQLGAARQEAGRRTANTGHHLWLGLRRAGARALPVLTAIASLPIVIAAAVLSGTARIGGYAMRSIRALSVANKPEYALAAVAAACCVALAGAQFANYTGVAVDAAAYGGKLGTIAAAPVTDHRHAGTAHAYVMLPLAAAGLVLIALTLAGHWRFGRLVALCGLMGMAVTLLIDLPKGLDAGRAGLTYAGADAQLEGGFWVELSASAMLLLTGALLASTVHRAHPEPRRRRVGARGRAKPTPLPG
jgi:hypothetical protein